MFNWLFEYELDILAKIRTSDYLDWIDKCSQIMDICYRHDTLGNRMKAIGTTIVRSGLADHYIPWSNEFDFDKNRDEQTLNIRCFPEALKELEKLDWFRKIGEVVHI
jgi:hypothetical protein